jgi:hypothetical protein
MQVECQRVRHAQLFSEFFSENFWKTKSRRKKNIKPAENHLSTKSRRTNCPPDSPGFLFAGDVPVNGCVKQTACAGNSLTSLKR